MTEAGHHWTGLDISQSMLGEQLGLALIVYTLSVQRWPGRERWRGTCFCGTWVKALDSGLEHLMLSSVSLLFSGCVMLTRSLTILPRDSITSSARCMLVWYAHPTPTPSLLPPPTQVRGGHAVFQFYPENPAQMELITHQAMRAGFTGGVVIDYPNSTKARK